MIFFVIAAFFLLVPLLLALALVSATPKAWTSVLLVGVTCVGLLIFSLDWREKGGLDALGIVFSFIACGGFVIGFAIGLSRRTGDDYLPREQGNHRSGQQGSDGPPSSIEKPLRIAFLLAGLAIPFFAIVVFGWGAYIEPAWLAHAVLVLVATLAATGMLFYRQRDRLHRCGPWPVASLLAGLAVSAVVIELWALVMAQTVVGKAKATAGDFPYCIQVARWGAERPGAERRPAQHWLDLTLVTMRGNVNVYHAVLVVDRPIGRTLYNWSYGSQSFRLVSEVYGSKLCEPRREFRRQFGLSYAAMAGCSSAA